MKKRSSFIIAGLLIFVMILGTTACASNRINEKTGDEVESVTEKTSVRHKVEDYKITFQEDENVPFWDVYDSFNRGEFEYVEALPGDLSRANFAAYLSYSGNDTDNEECVATYEDGFLMVYRLVNSGGDQTKYAGIVENDDSFIEKLNSLEYKKVDWAESQGEAEDYGAVYFKKDGKMYYCFTENIFSEN